MSQDRIARLIAQQGIIKARMITLKDDLETKREQHYAAYAVYRSAKDSYELLERELAEYEKVTRVPKGRSRLQKTTSKTDDFAEKLKSLPMEQRISILREVGLLPNP